MFINIYEEGVLSVSIMGSNEHDTNNGIQCGQSDVEKQYVWIVENNTIKGGEVLQDYQLITDDSLIVKVVFQRRARK